MPAAQNIYYYTVYQTTNLINGKFYIGKHTTTDPHDNYIGSGELLDRAIEKYGRNNFQKYILFYCNSEEEAFKIEGLIATEDLIAMDECYNLTPGGFAPPTIIGREHYLFGNNRDWEVKNKISQKNKEFWNEKHKRQQSIKISNYWNDTNEGNIRKKELSNYMINEFWTEKRKNEHANRMKEKWSGSGNPNYGKPMSKEHRNKISESNKGKTMSEEEKEKRRKPQSTITCPHCGKTGGISNMKRHHFNNCKKVK